MLESMVVDFTFIHRDWPLGLVMDDHDLWRLLKMGLEDPRPEDRPMDASTRSMRYAAIVGDRIQSNVEFERARVSNHSY